MAGGAAGGLLLVLLDRVRPTALAGLEDLSPPLPVRLFYGGITEELLIRWGVMSVLVWAFWVVFQGREGAPGGVWVWTAIAVSAVVFGLAHLPAAAALVGALTRPVVAYVVAGNALFGLVAGYLYWRSGLEAAILAHASARVLSYAVERF